MKSGVTLKALERMPTLKTRPYSYGRTSKHWKPIKHSELYALVDRMLGARMDICAERWHVVRAGHGLIGIIETIDQGFFVVRHSNDGFWSPTIFWGRRRLLFGACRIASKHRASVDLEASVDSAVGEAFDAQSGPAGNKICLALQARVPLAAGTVMITKLLELGVSSIVVRGALRAWGDCDVIVYEPTRMGLLACIELAAVTRGPVSYVDTLLVAPTVLGAKSFPSPIEA